MQKIKKIVIFLVVLLIIGIQKPTFADVGSFESYDSGSDWGGSSYSSSSSWDDDDDWDYYSGRASSSYDGPGSGLLGGISALVFIGAIIYYCIKVSKEYKERVGVRNQINRVQNTVVSEPVIDEAAIEVKIKEIDELFNKEEFNQKAKMLFVKMQNAWTNRKWEEIRPFETDELFEQHQSQIEGYIRNKQINVMDRICVLYSKLYRFEQKGDKDVLEIVLKSRMADYIINEDTDEIVRGDKNIERIKLYKLEFIRKTGVKTKPEGTGLETANCPNCGAPTNVRSSGECDYCGSIITNGDFGWVLNNLEPFSY